MNFQLFGNLTVMIVLSCCLYWAGPKFTSLSKPSSFNYCIQYSKDCEYSWDLLPVWILGLIYSSSSILSLKTWHPGQQLYHCSGNTARTRFSTGFQNIQSVFAVILNQVPDSLSKQSKPIFGYAVNMLGLFSLTQNLYAVWEQSLWLPLGNGWKPKHRKTSLPFLLFLSLLPCVCYAFVDKCRRWELTFQNQKI